MPTSTTFLANTISRKQEENGTWSAKSTKTYLIDSKCEKSLPKANPDKARLLLLLLHALTWKEGLPERELGSSTRPPAATTQKKKVVVTDRCYCYYFTEGESSRSESDQRGFLEIGRRYAKISNFQCECKSGFNGRLCENGKGDEGKRYRKRLVTGFCFV